MRGASSWPITSVTAMFKFRSGVRGFALGGACIAWGGGKGVQISLSSLRVVFHRGVAVLVAGYGFVQIIGWRVSAGFFTQK